MSLDCFRAFRVVAFGIGAGSAVAACHETTTAAKGPDVFVASAGNSQSGLAGRTLSIPLEVKVEASDGTPRPAVHIAWSVVSGGGSLSPSELITDPNGLSSTTWRLGDAVGEQRVSASVVGSSLPAVTFTATAIAPVVVIRYNGGSWHTELADSNADHIALASIWGVSSTDLFAVGTSKSSGGPLTLKLSAGSWKSARTIPISSVGAMTAIAGRTMSDVYAARRWALPPSGGREIAHYDGQAWSATYSESCSFTCLNGFNALWVSTGSDVIGVGQGGLITRYDGSAWSPLASGTTVSLNGVWGTSADHVLAVGENGTILLFDGTSWAAQSSGVTETLNGIWGASASDVFVVGNHGTVLHFDGNKWTTQTSGTTEDLFGVSGASGHVFGVGSNSTTLQFDGSRWTAQQFSVPINLRSVWAASATDAVAVGAPPPI